MTRPYLPFSDYLRRRFTLSRFCARAPPPVLSFREVVRPMQHAPIFLKGICHAGFFESPIGALEIAPRRDCRCGDLSLTGGMILSPAQPNIPSSIAARRPLAPATGCIRKQSAQPAA